MNEIYEVQELLCKMLGVDTSSHSVAGVDLRIRGVEVPTLTVTSRYLSQASSENCMIPSLINKKKDK